MSQQELLKKVIQAFERKYIVEYLDNWADQLDIAGMLAQIRDQAEVI